MALLQISEPGESPVPHQRKLAAGIDLGTTHSLVASVRSSVPEILVDEAGRGLLPSIVRYAPSGDIHVGYDAREFQERDSTNTIASVKRFIGRSLDEARAQGPAYEFADDATVRLKTAQGEFTPVEVSARILSVLRERAEGLLGGDLVGAVVTVPAYFDDAQRQATRDAARLAGLNVLRLLNEPTAAAIAYGLDRGAEGVYAVCDLGGGTFDLSVLRLSRGVFEVAATGGDTRLGGDDFDAAIAARVIQALQLEALGRRDQRALSVAARTAREALSKNDAVTFKAALSDGRDAVLQISRSQFEDWAQPLVQSMLDCASRTLRDARLRPQEIKGVVMVGGATRMPIVQREMGRLFGTAPLTDLDPDQVVALGAALQANLLVGNRSAGDDWLLLDVTPLSLGLETMGGIAERVIPRNSAIPVARAQEFTTFKDGQSAMSIHVVQGERELVGDCRSLARFELRGIPPMAAGAARIRVTFQVDADGLLNVSACEASTGIEAAVSVKPSYGLSDDEVSRMLAEGMANAGVDAKARALREQQIQLQQLIESVRAAVAADGDLLAAEEKSAIVRCLRNAGVAVSSSDSELVRRAAHALSSSTDAFAARRMDRSIRAALAGRRIDDIAR